ncbi:MAG: thiamine pyrophosphate-requiring protein [Blastomonas sp.]
MTKAEDGRSTVSAGEVFLRRLSENGVEYFFANAGTDFAPVIEAIARGNALGEKLPETIVIPHESAAIGMAHGYYLATGRPQAVMVHTNVGLANAVMGLLNAASDQIPMLVASGITSVMDDGPLGHRTSPIAWGQNMRDQFGLVRDATKWDGLLAFPSQAAELVDRAFAAAMSDPRGPVYLGLPREVLCAETELPTAPPRNAPARIAPQPAELDAAAALLDKAERPLIIVQRADGAPDAEGFAALGAFAEQHAIPVVEMAITRSSLSGLSPMHAGFNMAPEIAEADVILALDVIVPWLPHRDRLAESAKVIAAGADPYHLRTPVRNFPADIALTGRSADIIAGLAERMPERDRSRRYAAIAERNNKRREASLAARPDEGVLTSEQVSRAINRLAGDHGRVITELGAKIPAMRFAGHDQIFQNPLAGGLGWGFPAALGMQLADRERLTIATLGDGAYMFANPVACHQIAEALALPLMVIVFNNGVWNAVRNTSLQIYPDGYAAKANQVPLTSLEPAPDYCKVAEASRAWTVRISDPKQLDTMLDEAARIVREERRQVLVEVMVKP